MQLTDVLRGGRQCDEDGVEIVMSRQACLEAADMIDRLHAENELMQSAMHGLARYFTSGNDVPVERATILAKDFWRISGTALCWRPEVVTSHEAMLHDLPPEGSALRKLGARLADLLDDDHWAECERLLFDVADEANATLEDKADVVSIALRRAWQLGQTYWQQADSESWSQNKKADETQAKFQTLDDETRATLMQPNAE